MNKKDRLEKKPIAVDIDGETVHDEHRRVPRSQLGRELKILDLPQDRGRVETSRILHEGSRETCLHGVPR